MALLCATAVAVLPATPAQADQVRDNQWHLRYLKVVEAHRITQGAGVTVAVIDTGVDPHPDLRNNLLSGTDIHPGGRGNGQADDDGHGTQMAGLIAGHGRPGSRGVLGIAPSAKLLPIDYVSKADPSNPDNAAAGIDWAVSKGAKVISIASAGTPTPELQSSVNAALEKDVVIVAGGGNTRTFLVGYPAAYAGVVAVSAADKSGNRADFAATGSEIVISAPGVDIYSTSPGGGYETNSGTSPATAIVAGAAALVRSKYPDLSAREVVHRLTATAADKGARGRDEEYGYGVLNLVGALTADVPPLEGAAEPSASAAPSPTAGNPDAAAPDRDNSGSTTVLVSLGAVGVLVVLGFLIALLVLLARRRSAE
ncbi:type VII secretion-associated serine protease mycosin [Plantactinospora sp. CA-290183]|uniref:type VII secretion-associated serine protease mycosin n=1 Tax=Plantactinospora sp. CA-290183 TaxID=3240006 RepID=UPI003D940607